MHKRQLWLYLWGIKQRFMIFRQATTEDAKELISLTHTAFLRYAREVGKSVKGISETYDDIIWDIEHKYVLLAIEASEIIGAVRVETIENISYISRLCASNSYKELNVGAMLIDKIKETVTTDALCLHTSTKISSLVVFYYKCGFYIEDISHQRGYPRGLFVCNLKNDNDIDFCKLTENK